MQLYMTNAPNTVSVVVFKVEQEVGGYGLGTLGSMV